MHTWGHATGSMIRGICLAALLYGPLSAHAQPDFCEGDLGDNIFTDGDFGSGVPNVVQSNPGLAPGFVYTTNVPPDDGEYTLTNNMRIWNNLFPAWIRIGDNDIDPEGYMMVVNASFEPGIFYEKIIDNLCENTLYQFSADVINLIRTSTTGHILPNVSFLIDDVENYTTGPIPQDEDWHTYGFTFTTASGQTSVRLALRNNAPGGIGNDLALDNIRFQACGPESDVDIMPAGKVCENSIFPELHALISADTGFLQWQISLDLAVLWTDIPGATGRTYQVPQLNAGIYYFRYLYSNSQAALANPNCHVVSQFILMEVVPAFFTLRDTLCEGLSFEFGGEEYMQTGMYVDSFVSSMGCDSIVTLHLEIIPDPHIVAEFGTKPESCEGAGDGEVFLQSLSPLNQPYHFMVEDSIVPPPLTNLILPPGIYTVSIETPYGCFDSDVVTIPAGPPLRVMTDPDTTVLLGHSVLVQSSTSIPVDTVYWTPASTVSCPFCLDTYLTPLDETTYVIRVETSSGCAAGDTITIRVDRTLYLYVPNIFSPDGNQVNDLFYLTTDPRNVTAIKQFFVYDRWGGVIAHHADLPSSNTVMLWDGQTSAGPALPGVYIYLLEIMMADGRVVSVRGDVTLVR